MAIDEPMAAEATGPSTTEASLLEAERAKHALRAAKFGVEYQDPAKRKDLRHEARKEAVLARARPPAFATGIDILSEEEIQRRRERAARFQTDDTLSSYQPVVDPEIIAKCKARAERFGTEYQPDDAAGLMDVDLLEQKRDVQPDVQRRREAVHLYGVDLLNTKEVLSYFSEYSPVYVEWLDDSSCNILFRDEFTAKRAIFGMGKPLPPEDIPAGQELAASVDVTQIEKLWHKGPDFVKDSTPIPLIFRVATVEDKRPPPGTHTTRRLWQTSAPKQENRRQHVAGEQQQRRQRQQPQQPQQHPLNPLAEDDSVQTVGRKGRRRKRRSAGDVAMVDAEEYDGTDLDAGDFTQQSALDGDARMDIRRTRPRVAGLFSAAAAGIVLPVRGREARQKGAAASEADAASHADAAQAPPSRGLVSYGDL